MKNFKLFKKLLVLAIVLLTWNAHAYASIDLYLDISAADWPADGATIKVYPGTGSDVTGSRIGSTNLYKFTVSSAKGTMYFKRMSGSTVWNQVYVSYNSSYEVYKLTGWGASTATDECTYATYHISNVTKNNYIYFDNTQTNWSASNRYFIIGHDNPTKYSKKYSMSAIGHTKLWYVGNTSDNWSDATYYGIINPTSSWGSATDWGSDNLSNGDRYTAAYTAKRDLNSGKTVLFTPASGSNGAALSISSDMSSYTGLNYSQTVKKYTSTDGGSTYSAASINSGTVTINPYKMTGNGTASNSSNTGTINTAGTTSASKDAVYTGEVALTASNNTGYDFVGWFEAESGGSAVSTNTSYTYNAPKSTKTIYARFKAHTYSLTLNANGGESGSSSATVLYGTSTVSSITNPTKADYVFAGWYSAEGGLGTMVIDAYGHLQPNSAYTDASGNWTATADKTLYAGWLTVHTPGTYEGTYGKLLTIYNCEPYELYGVSKTNSSTTYRLTAGEKVAVTTDYSTAPNKVLTYNSTTLVRDGWLEGNHNGNGSGGALNSNEFFPFPTSSTYHLTMQNAQYLQFCVNGYSGFSIIAKDYNTSDKYFKVEIDGTADESVSKYSSGNGSIRTYSLSPSNTNHIVKITAIGGNTSDFYAFSLKVDDGYPKPSAFSCTSVTSSSATLSITDSYDTNDYEFYYSTTATAPTSGTSATTSSTSKTPTITGLSAETKYYIWVRSKSSNTCKSAWKALSGDYFTTNAASTTYSVTAATSTGTTTYGTVSAALSELAEDETTTITASPATGYQVTNWAVSGTGASISPSGSSNSNTTTLTMGTADATVTVTFGLIDYDVDYNSPTGGDYTTKVASGSATSTDKTATMGQTVALVATPSSGYVFSSWTITNTDNSTDITSTLLTGSKSTTASTSFTMPAANISIVANFARLYTVTKGTHTNGDFTISTSSAVSGTTITLTATPNTGYVFDKWTTSGTSVTLTNANVSPTTFTMPSGNVTVNAVFKATPNIYYYKDATHYDNGTYKNPTGGTASGSDNVSLTTPWTICNACVTGVTSVVATSCKYDNKTSATEKWATSYIKLRQDDGAKITFTIAAGYTGTISLKSSGWDGSKSYSMKLSDSGDNISPSSGSMGGQAQKENNFNLLTWSNKEAGAYVFKPTASGKNLYISEIDIQTTPKTYTITLKPGVGGSGSDGSLSVTYGASTTTDMSHSITQTGYTISGWYTSSSVKVLNADGSFAAENVTGYITSGKWSKADNCDLYAWWSPNPYAVTFDATTNGGALSGSSPKNVIFDETSITSCPVGQKTGYVFDGWYTKASGGKKVINPNGSLVASITEDAVTWTNGDRKWKKTSATTVYAVYVAPTTLIQQPAKIAGKRVPIDTLDAKNHPEIDSVIVHQLIDPTPYGTCNISYKLCYSNHVQLDVQPTIHYGIGAGVGYDTVWMPMEEIQMYELVAYLRTGSTRGAGDLVTTDTALVSVEKTWPVKVRYIMDGVDLREPTEWPVYPSIRTTEVRIPKERNGYELDHLEYGVGITSDSAKYINEGATYATYVKAANAATIIAHYRVPANTVYFFDAFEDRWYTPYIFDYGTTGYWDSGLGAGSSGHLGTRATRVDFMDRMYMMPIGSTTTKLALGSDEQKNNDGTGFAHFYDRTYTPEGWDHSITVTPQIFYRTDFNQALAMFVPVAKSSSDYYVENDKARYFRGFWTRYSPDPDSTGYFLKVYDRVEVEGGKLIQSIPMRLTQTGEDGTWELTATMDLEAGHTYGFKYTKATGASTVDWYGNSGTMTSANHTDWLFSTGTNNCGLTTTSAGDYTFHLHCVNYGTKAANTASDSEVQGKMVMTVDYATLNGDFRIVYQDDSQLDLTDGVGVEPIASQSIRARANGQDTVTFYIRKNAEGRSMKFQKFTDGAWADVAGGTIALTNTSGQTFTVSKDTTYQIYVQQNADGTSIEATGMDYYSGLYYIRTDCVDEHKWDYKQSMEAHRMVESDYASHLATDPFTHYYVSWVGANGNVKYVVATQYSPTLTDTLITDNYANVAGGNLPSAGASVRFMYNKGTNAIKRAYLAGAQGGALDPDYLKLTESSSSKMKNMSGSAITSITFTDLGNFAYQAEIQAQPGLTGKLTAAYNSQTQYFKGSAESSETILGGTGSSWQHIVMTYDFKTNRLICAWTPGDTIDETMSINADVMIIRRGKNDAEQIIFKTNENKLTDVKYIYGVIQLDYSDLVGRMYSWDWWAYEHCMYYISFPFDVLVSDITGVGTIGQDWRIQRYNGALRAEKGWFEQDGVKTWWEDVHAGDTLHAYEGYSLLLARTRFNDSSNPIWKNKTYGDKVYLFFPSLNATTGIIADGEVTFTVPAHECKIERPFLNPYGEYVSHKISDSHWNMLGMPLFENKTAFSIAAGPTYDMEYGSSKTLQYLYAWNSAGNTLGIQLTLDEDWEFKTMYSYMVQYTGAVTFKGSTVNKIVAAKRNTEKKNYYVKLELTKDEQFIGRTYVELRENAVDSFLLNEDICMVRNGVNADLYTIAGGYEAAANVLPIADQVVPVGIAVKKAGTYVFSMPSNFDGEVILVDTYHQTRTNLAIDDYEIALPTGEITDRFYLEININKVPTAIDGVSGGSMKDGKAHKYIENGQMYILQNGLIYDAQGKRVQ